MSNRRITLYIDGKPADMDAESLVLFNYTASDLSSPAAVKNTYSQQETLPASENNDRIFSSIYRADYHIRLDAGTTFNPLVRTPFALYDETGAILESGYLKLNTVKNKDGVRSYVVTLYGGLGSFFYTLAYDDEGEAMTLGALPLLGDDPSQKIDFRINRETVNNAWKRLATPPASSAIVHQFDVVNFAPCYNGLPAGEFDASKGVGNPTLVGGETTKEVDGKTYETYGPNNDALYDFGEDHTEWEMHDLRSYLQRPVVSVKGLFEAIVRYAAAKGFTVNLDPAWFTDNNPYYRRAWMTLPLLAGRAVTVKEEKTISISGSQQSAQVSEGSYNYLAIPLTPSISLSNATVTVRCAPEIFFQNRAAAANICWLNAQVNNSTYHNDQPTGTVVFVQLQLLNAAGTIVGASKIRVCLGNKVDANPRYDLTAEQLAEQAKLEGCKEDKYGVEQDVYRRPSEYSILPIGGRPQYGFVFPSQVLGTLEATAYDAVSARIIVEPRALYYGTNGVNPVVKVGRGRLYSSFSREWPTTLYEITTWGAGVPFATLHYTTSTEYRSGVPVTQEGLFADTMSPMEFLLSYTKTFGLHYLYDTARKQVDIVTRNTLYGGRPTIDLQERIDRSQEITTEPIPMDSKWLEFAPANIEGEFAEYYKAKYGREYGIQKVNTGFAFDANTTQALADAQFNGGAEVLERSKYYLYVLNKRIPRIPPPIVDAKTTYKLFLKDDAGELQSTELDYPNLTLPDNGFSGFRYFNANKGYDGVPKLQCHGDDNSGTDGAGILLIHRGRASSDPAAWGDEAAQIAYDEFIISDDSAAMYDLAGKPCWELSGDTPATYMPSFGRFDIQGPTITRSMELGTPAEIDNPVIEVGRYTSVYERCWAAYIADRYNVNTRTCTAYVDLRGLQPGPEMLRDFYYFDGAIWVLNKIANYSLSAPGTTQCEFVKVQDQAAYTTGQAYTIEGEEYDEWDYLEDTRSRLVKPYEQDVYPDGSLGERRYRDGYIQTQRAATTLDWDGETYWNGSCGADYYYVDYRKVRDKYTWSDAVRYSDYRNGESRSRRIDGQCGWVRAWRATSDWYRTGSTCNAAGVNGAYDCDGTYSVTYWNEGQHQSYCYPDMSGSTGTRTIWRVGPEATREQVDGQCGYTPKAYQLEVSDTSWNIVSMQDRTEMSSLRQPDGLLVMTTSCQYVGYQPIPVFAMSGIRLVAPDGTTSPIKARTLSFERRDGLVINCSVSTTQSSSDEVRISFRSSGDTTLQSFYDGKITITHETGAAIKLVISVSFHSDRTESGGGNLRPTLEEVDALAADTDADTTEEPEAAAETAAIEPADEEMPA